MLGVLWVWRPVDGWDVEEEEMARSEVEEMVEDFFVAVC